MRERLIQLAALPAILIVSPRLTRLARGAPTRSGPLLTRRLWQSIVFLALVVAGLSGTARGSIAFVNAANNKANAATVTVTISTTAGNDVVVVVSANTSGGGNSVTSVTDTGGSSYAQRASIASSGGNEQVFIWSARNVAAATSVTVNIGSSTRFVACVAQYSGVQALGGTTTNTGTSTGPTVSLTTQDANNFAVAGFGAIGTATYSASVGNLRTSATTSGGPGSSQSGGALNENTAATASSVTNTVTLSASEQWAAAALELRSTTGGAPAPKRLTLLGVGD